MKTAVVEGLCLPCTRYTGLIVWNGTHACASDLWHSCRQACPLLLIYGGACVALRSHSSCVVAGAQTKHTLSFLQGGSVSKHANGHQEVGGEEGGQRNSQHASPSRSMENSTTRGQKGWGRICPTFPTGRILSGHHRHSNKCFLSFQDQKPWRDSQRSFPH